MVLIEVMDFTYSIRPATPKDADDVVGMITELGTYENMLDQCKLTTEQFREDGFGADPVFQCLIAESNTGGEVKTVGYALFYYVFSTFIGKNVHLENLYVKEPYSNHGIGTDLMTTAAKIAIENGCSKYCLQCLGWNTKALDLYKYNGAKDLTVSKDYHYIRFDTEELYAFANKQSNEA